MNGMQDGGCHGYGSTGNMMMNSFYAPDCQTQMEVVVESVFVAKKDVQHLDTGEVIPD